MRDRIFKDGLLGCDTSCLSEASMLLLLLIASFVLTFFHRTIFMVYEIHCQIHADIMQGVQELVHDLCLVARMVFERLRYYLFVLVLAWEAD